MQSNIFTVNVQVLKTEIEIKESQSSKEGNHARTVVYPAWSEPSSEPVMYREKASQNTSPERRLYTLMRR